MGKLVDITGLKFGRWTAISFSHRKSGSGTYYWLCRCECGTERLIIKSHLKSGASSSCGCYAAQEVSARRYKHGQSLGNNGRPTGAYESWQGAKDRCFNKNDPRYPEWGGRGITMCLEWKDSFLTFYAHMGARPEGLTLDRIDVNGHYEPGNCRWADKFMQSQNRRNVLCKK